MKIMRILKLDILKKAILLTALMSLSLIGLTACNTKDNKSNIGSYPMTIVDNSGASVVIEKEPKKIVSLSPVITEIVAAIGAEDKLVGRTSYCDYPISVEKIEVIGDLITVNLEKIVELSPDIVIGSAFLDQGIRDQLENAGITVVTVYTEDSFEGTYKDIKTIGQIINHLSEADEVVLAMKDKLEDLKKKVAEAKTKPKVYLTVGFGSGGEFTATGDTFINEMIELAGGENIAKDGKQWSFSLEKIVERNPEILIYSEVLDKNELVNTVGYKELDSVKNGKVFPIESNLVERTGPRLVKGLEALVKIIHPEL